MTDQDREKELLRAQEWVFFYMTGAVKSAVVVEQSGPPIKASAVMAAVMTLLADQQLMLMPMRADTEEVDRADHSEG